MWFCPSEKCPGCILNSVEIHNATNSNVLWHPISYRKKINGSLLAKLEKSITLMLLPWNLKGRSSWSKKFQVYMKNYNLCEYMKFRAFSWKSIFANNYLIKVRNWEFFSTHVIHITVIIFRRANFISTKSVFWLNTDFPSQFCVF